MSASSNARQKGAALSAVRRFLLTLLVIRFLPFPLGWLPVTEWLAEKFYTGRAALVQAASLRVVGYAVNESFTGSGDTTYEWLGLAVDTAMALALSLAWPLAVARRPTLTKLARAVRPYLRFGLAACLLSYGISKVLPMQFGTPSRWTLSQTYGDSSPMHLLWTFMGASRPYSIAAGVAEVLAGLLLLLEWTTGLGALVAAGVMSNVVLLNFCYDVPVKIGSTTYLLTALALLAPDAGRMARALWATRPRLKWSDRRTKLGTLGHAVVVVAVLYAGGRHLGETSRWEPRQWPFAGFYDVTCDSGAASSPGWRNVEVTSHIVQVRLADGRGERFRLGPEDGTGTMSATRMQRDGETAPVRLAFTRETDGTVAMSVHAKDGERRACLRVAPRPEYLLTTRGFHWVNEFPYNF